MESNKDYTEQIERYLDGEMENSELDAFKKEIEINPDLRAELEFYSMANSVIIENKISSVKATIELAKNEYVQKQRFVKIRNVIIAVTGILVAIGILYSWQAGNPAKKTDPQTLKPEVIIDTTSAKPEVLTVDTSNLIDIKPDSLSSKSSVQKPINTKVEDKTSKNLPLPVKDSVEIVDKKPVVVFQYTAKAKPIKNTTIQPNPQIDKAPVSSCESVQITANFNTSATCIAESKGEIHITNVAGGTAPYTFQLAGYGDNTNGMFSNLQKGDYNITITDKNLCTETIGSIRIAEKPCQLDLYMEATNTSSLDFPAYEKAGVLTIFDKKGMMVHSTNIVRNEELEWNGNTNAGILAPGYYPFVIKFEDGTVQNGSITVIP